MTLNEFKKTAETIFLVPEINTSGIDPISYLYSLSWNISSGESFSEDNLNQMNLSFDERTCFGIAVKAAVILDSLFPKENFYFGEVLEDLLREVLLNTATPEKWKDETYIAEILMYENPHVIIVDETGRQFDPLFKILSESPQTLRHPKVGRYDMWTTLYSSYLVSESIKVQKEDNLDKSFELLFAAQKMCPELVLIEENLSSRYGMMHDLDASIAHAKAVSEKRKDAKTLWVLWHLTQDSTYKEKLIKDYDIAMLNFLNKQYL